MIIAEAAIVFALTRPLFGGRCLCALSSGSSHQGPFVGHRCLSIKNIDRLSSNNTLRLQAAFLILTTILT